MERGMNERIRRLRRESLETEAHIDMERAKIETEVYRRYEGTVSVPELRALVLKHYFAEKDAVHRGRRAVGGREGKRAAGSTHLSGIMLPYSTGSPCDE